MYELTTHDEAVADIEELLIIHRHAGLRVVALIEQLAEDQDLLDRLTQHSYGGTPRNPSRGAVISISKWLEAQRVGMNLWRLRDFELSKMGHEFRIIYAFNPKENHYFILAVVERGFNYDSNHPITQRVFATYRDLEEQWG